MVDTGRDENVCGAKESVHSVVASLGVASDLGCLQTSAVDLPPSLSESSPSQPGGASVSNLVIVEVEFWQALEMVKVPPLVLHAAVGDPL
jgi:hypothetical protein